MGHELRAGAPGRAASFARVLLAYVVAAAVAGAAGWLAAALVGRRDPLLVALVGDLAATVTVFAFSVAWDNTSVYDPYWSVAPPLLALWFAARPLAVPDRTRTGVVVALVALWALRLTWNWARGWRGLGQEDWRYADIREKTGAAYWPASFFALQLMPTMMVVLGSLSLYVALSRGTRPLGWLDAVAAAVTLAAIAIEATADRQLLRWTRSHPEPRATFAGGLWRWSRHPNYFAEVLFWWGLALFAVAAAPFRWWMLLGPAAITALFLGVSIPLIERRMLARHPSFAERRRSVSALVPWPPRSAAPATIATRRRDG
jgi:steroid 5-alpha reductase family enzyme